MFDILNLLPFIAWISIFVVVTIAWLLSCRDNDRLRRQLRQQLFAPQKNEFGCENVDARLVREQTAKNCWKNFALALEVLCEACVENDEAAANNAQQVVVAERQTLRILGEYDD